MVCPYCGNEAKVVTGAVLYPHRAELAAMKFWRCVPCDAHVGCHHGDPARPLGRMANAALRRAKSSAHAAFDPFWKAQGWKRGAAYRWLSQQLDIDAEAAHIGMFDEAQCARVIEAVESARQRTMVKA